MPSLTTAIPPTATVSSTPDPDETITPYSYATSKIVKTAVAAGVIVLALSALVLFFKVSSWIRYHQRLRRQHYLTTILQSEQRANAYEIAAWSDEPGQAPVRVGEQKQKKTMKERRNEIRMMKRAGANAHAVQEWEGVAA